MKIKSPTEFDSLLEMVLYFKTEKKCLQYLEQCKWGGKIRCRQCGCDKVYRLRDKGLFKCGNCNDLFSAKVDTIFEDSKLPMIKWFMAMYLISNHKKGISSYQLARDIKVTQKTAWFMSHRIRKMFEETHTDKMEGIILTDETFVGGKNKNRHKDKKVQNAQGRSFKDKVPVFGLLEKDGKIRCFVMRDTSKESIQPLVRKNVKENSVVVSDEWWGYTGLKRDYDHQIVEHRYKQYKNAEGFSTNAVEGFWSHFKRAIYGIYHKVSPKHLQKYVDEISFRWNTKGIGEGSRLRLVMEKVNCTLKYKQLIQPT